jgi:hypothetical protein
MSGLADELLRVVEPKPSAKPKRKTDRESDIVTKPIDDHDEARRFIAAQLDTTKEGYVRPTMANLTRILGTDPAWLGVVSWDEFRDGVRRRKASRAYRTSNRRRMLRAPGPMKTQRAVPHGVGTCMALRLLPKWWSAQSLSLPSAIRHTRYANGF